MRPSLDDKVLVSWNALMITAMVKGFRAVGDDRYLQAAIKCSHFIRTQMRRPDGRLWHSWRQGKANFDAYLDDYSYLIDALAELLEFDFVVWHGVSPKCVLKPGLQSSAQRISQ